MSSKKYVQYFLLIVIGGLVVVSGFNAWVDPYDIFGTTKIDGFNANKPETGVRPRLSKAYIMERNCPANIVIGNSRSIAIDADYAAWPTKNNYNYSLTSGSMYEVYRYFQHAVASCDIKTVLLSLDFLMFMDGSLKSINFSENRLAVTEEYLPTKWRIIHFLEDAIPVLLSTTAVKSSVRTIRQQKTDEENTISQTVNDLRCGAPVKANLRIVNKGGHQVFIAETNRKLVRSVSLNWDEKSLKNSLSYLRKLYNLAYKNKVDLKIIIPPSHYSLYESLNEIDMIPKIFSWFESIVELNELAAEENKSQPYRIIDFSNKNTITTEIIPSKNEVQRGMKWFWESLHFTEETGNLMLDKIFFYKRENCKLPEDFGVDINSGNVKEYLKKRQSQ